MKLTLLRTLAAVTWIAAIVGAFTGFDNHRAFTALDHRLWLLATATALITTQAAMMMWQHQSNQALADAVLNRPLYRDPTGPLAVVPDQPVPASAGRTRHGRHATLGRG